MNKILSITLLLLTLLSQTSIAFAMHYCGGKLVSAQFGMGQYQNGCDMDDSDCASRESQVTKSSCCANCVISIAQTSSYEFFTVKLLNIRTPVSHNLCELATSYYFYNNKVKFYFLHKPPPHLDKDIPVLYQTFLI